MVEVVRVHERTCLGALQLTDLVPEQVLHRGLDPDDDAVAVGLVDDVGGVVGDEAVLLPGRSRAWTGHASPPGGELRRTGLAMMPTLGRGVLASGEPTPVAAAKGYPIG